MPVSLPNEIARLVCNCRCQKKLTAASILLQFFPTAQNRAEWERKGQEVVAELIESVRHLGNPGNGDEEEKSFIPQDLIHHEPIAKRMSLSQDLLDLHDEVST